MTIYERNSTYWVCFQWKPASGCRAGSAYEVMSRAGHREPPAVPPACPRAGRPWRALQRGGGAWEPVRGAGRLGTLANASEPVVADKESCSMVTARYAYQGFCAGTAMLSARG